MPQGLPAKDKCRKENRMYEGAKQNQQLCIDDVPRTVQDDKK